jgi:hypothetical protein
VAGRSQRVPPGARAACLLLDAVYSIAAYMSPNRERCVHCRRAVKKGERIVCGNCPRCYDRSNDLIKKGTVTEAQLIAIGSRKPKHSKPQSEYMSILIERLQTVRTREIWQQERTA